MQFSASHQPKRRFDSFEAAEKSARMSFKRTGFGATIYALQEPNARGRCANGAVVATISSDGTGRVWTDLTSQGATFI